MATLGTEESGHCVEVTVMGRMGCNMTVWGGGEYNMIYEPSSAIHSLSVNKANPEKI